MEKSLNRGLFVRWQAVHPLLGERAVVRGTATSEYPEWGYDCIRLSDRSTTGSAAAPSDCKGGGESLEHSSSTPARCG